MSPELNPDGIEERFFVLGRMEILAQLNELIYRHEPVTVHFGQGEHFSTHLLEARDDDLVFENGDDAGIRQRLVQAGSCIFLAFPNGIRVQFAAGPVQVHAWGESTALRVSLPQRLARVQRQESFRLQVPPRQAPDVAVFAADGARLGIWPLHNLSVGGLGVTTARQSELALAPQLARVRLELPGHGTLECAVTLRHATALAGKDGRFSCRIGLGFQDLPDAMRVAIQRYIVDVEQARRQAPARQHAEG